MKGAKLTHGFGACQRRRALPSPFPCVNLVASAPLETVLPPSADSARNPAAGPVAEDAARPVTTARWLGYRVCEGLWRLLVQLMRVMPPGPFRRLCTPILKMLVLCAVSRRRIVAVMDAAFGDSWTPAAKRGLAKGVQQRMAENVLDCLVQMGYPERLREVLDIRGIEHLEAALAKGRGVIALGFHLGNFFLAAAAMGVAGHPVHSLMRFLDDERLTDLVRRHSRSFHTELIPSLPRRRAVGSILAVLRDNGIVVMLADNLKRGELETTLFGQPVRTARGSVSLALRTRAAVVPVYLVRGGDGGLQLVIEPEMEMARTGDLAADLAANTERIMGLLEDTRAPLPGPVVLAHGQAGAGISWRREPAGGAEGRCLRPPEGNGRVFPWSPSIPLDSRFRGDDGADAGMTRSGHGRQRSYSCKADPRVPGGAVSRADPIGRTCSPGCPSCPAS